MMTRALTLSILCASGFGQSTTVVVPPSQAPPQKPAGAALAKSGGDFGAEPVVLQRFDTVYRMTADGTGTRTMTVEGKIQSESALKASGVVTVGYAGNSEHVEIGYVRVRRPDGTVAATDVADAIEMPMPVTQAAPFYSDLKQMQLPVRSLHVGDTLEWQAKVVRTKPEAAGEFWGQESFVEDTVTLAQTLELRVPKGLAVTVWSKKDKPTETVEGEERVYRWTYSQLKPTAGKEAEAAKEAAKKKVWTAEQELNAKEGKLPDVAWTTFKSWAAVGAWYRELEGTRMAPDAAVKAKVAEVTAGKATEVEKIEAIYGYVSTQIRYIGVAFGVGRYQPHAAGTVLENQYGDCKDKHTLLAAMLQAIGVHADAVLIGAGIRFNEAVPSPGVFNHLITALHVEGKPVWLDATAEVAPYGLLLPIIRDREGLAVPETGVARLERTPAEPPFPPFQKMEAVGSLDELGTSNSRLVLTLRGDDEVIVRSALRGAAPAQYGELVQRMSQGMGYAGTTSNAEVGKLEDTAVPLRLAYDYKREKSGDWDNLRILPQLPPVVVPDANEKDPPVQALALGVRRVETATSEMKLPEGWGAELPEAVHAHSAYVNLDETYRLDKGTIYTERKLEVRRETVPVAEWKEYARWVKASGLEDGERFIQLRAKGGRRTAATGVDAGTLVREAYGMIQGRQLDGAEMVLDRAKAANTEQARLWSTYGYLAFQRKQYAAAIEDYDKELARYPDAYGVYGSVADAQLRLGKPAESEKTLRKWAEEDSADPLPEAGLAKLLMDEGKAKEAIVAAKAGLERAGKSEAQVASAGQGTVGRLQLQLGKAQKMAGLKEDERATLNGLLNSTDDPGLINDAAYELAEDGLELQLAETKTRSGLNTLEIESRGWALDDGPEALVAKSRMLPAMWDTMGWILYREGQTEAAAGYVRASWMNRQSETVGKHLGEIEAKLGNEAASKEAYRLAAATTDSSMREAQAKLQAMRKVAMGPAKGLNGTAEYMLLLEDGHVEVAKPVGDVRMPPGTARLMGLKMPAYWPKGSQARLARKGLLNCHSGICELVLEP